MRTMFAGFDRRLWIRFWGMMLLNIGNFMIQPFMSLYLATVLGAGLGIISLVLVCRPIGSFFGGMLGGYYADRIGRKPVMLIGLVSDALCLLGYALTQEVLWFAALSLLKGLSASFSEPANAAMVADVTKPEDRTRAYSLMYMGANVGAAVGPLLAVSVLLAHPAALFTAMAAITLLYALVVYLFIPESKPAHMVCESEACKRAQSRIGYGFIFRDVKLMLFLAGSIVLTLGYNQMPSYLPLYLQEILPEAAWLFGVMYSINGVLCVVLSMPFANWLSRYNPYHVIKAGGAVYAAGMFILALNQSVMLMIAGYAVFTIGEIITASVSKKLVADFAPEDMRARYMGASSVSWVVAATIGPLAGGQLMQHFGGQVLLIVFAFVMSSSVLFYRLLDLRVRPSVQKRAASL